MKMMLKDNKENNKENNNYKKIEINKIVNLLKEMYPDASCSLDFTTPFELLVAVCLSAQCTDERVNKTTPSIFAKYKTPKDFSNATLEELEKLIHPCGFYKNKSKNLKAAGKKILDDFNGEVPQTIKELIQIPGVGRKSANVIMLEAFNNPQGIAVDTHCKRIANRLALSTESDPVKIEQDLCRIIPKEHWKDINHIFMWHGRNLCTSQNPKCDKCKLKSYCKYKKEQTK